MNSADLARLCRMTRNTLTRAQPRDFFGACREEEYETMTTAVMT